MEDYVTVVLERGSPRRGVLRIASSEVLHCVDQDEK